MYRIEKELFEQYDALLKTYNYLLERKEDIITYVKREYYKSITLTGSGSSYSICQSGEISSKIHVGIPANSFSAGDMMLNFSHYQDLLQDTLLVIPSRSGSTSEVLLAVEKSKRHSNAGSISICTRENSKLSELTDLTLEIPWAFDESVCQTRTVTNLYMACLIILSFLSDNKKMLAEIKNSLNSGTNFIKDNKNTLEMISKELLWDKVVLLADSELRGIANEGAIAFKEISMTPSSFYNILDVRHGPIVMIDIETLVIIACSQYGLSYQKVLIKDLKKKGATVVTVSSFDVDELNSDYNIEVPIYENYGVMGIPFIFIPQAISYFKALTLNINPDKPAGLQPWIKLKTENKYET